MNLNRIMDNIYGDRSSQSFDGVSLSGGRIEHKQSSVRYVDAPSETTGGSTKQEFSYQPSIDYSISESSPSWSNYLTGGGATDTTVYANPNYVDNADLQLFIKAFFLQHLFSSPNKNSIYIIPPTDVLKKMISDFKAKLKAEKITEATKEAELYAVKTELPYKGYIFDVYGKGSPNNENYDYQVSSTFPASGMDTVLRRTNRLSQPYFFKFASKEDIKIATNAKLEKANSLKFVAKCSNDCFVLSGEVPAPGKAASASNVVTANLSGGAKKNNLRSLFKSLVRKYGDIDQAAYDFVSTVALAEAERTGDPDAAAAHMASAYSGDFVHSAFSILADDSFGPVDEDDVYDDDDIEDMHQAIIDNYKPKQMNINLDHARAAIKSAYMKSKSARSGYEASKSIVSDMMKMYGKYPLSMFKADLATALVKRNSTEDGIDYAFDMIDAIDGASTNASALSGGMIGGQLDSQITFDDGVSSPLSNAIYSAFSASPFIGVIARGYAPMLMSKKKRRRIMKKKKFAQSAFEDGEQPADTDKPFEFQLIEDDTPVEAMNAELNDAPPEKEGEDGPNEEFDAFY